MEGGGTSHSGGSGNCKTSSSRDSSQVPGKGGGGPFNGLEIIQSMIEISAIRLEGLRTQCATSAELTQQEIRSLETKLVKMFTELLVTKERLPERPPLMGMPCAGTGELKQWLRVVGEYLQGCGTLTDTNWCPSLQV